MIDRAALLVFLRRRRDQVLRAIEGRRGGEGRAVVNPALAHQYGLLAALTEVIVAIEQMEGEGKGP